MAKVSVTKAAVTREVEDSQLVLNLGERMGEFRLTREFFDGAVLHPRKTVLSFPLDGAPKSAVLLHEVSSADGTGAEDRG